MTDLPTDLPPLSAGDFDARAGRESAAADVAQAPFVRRVIVGLLIAGVLNFAATGASVLFATEARNSAGQLRAVTLGNGAVIRRVEVVQMEGRREFCQLFQRNHHAAVTQLRQTITYLRRTDTPSDSLTRTIRANVPILRGDVKDTRLPVVCKTVLAPVNLVGPKRPHPKHGPRQFPQYRSNP